MKQKIIVFIFLIFFPYINVYSQHYKAVIKEPITGVYERPSVNSPLFTQSLLNEEVMVLSENGSFAYAKVPDGYTGYIKLSDITTDLSSIKAEGDKIIVKTAFAKVYDSVGNEIYNAPMSSIFFGRLVGNNYRIILPENVIGFIRKESSFSIPRNKDIVLKARESFVEVARQFIGTKYLWGGCSANGIDCSGLTYIVAKINGLKIPRDSHPQSEKGTYIELLDAQPGDQLFFGEDSRRTKVSHTGIYLGNGNFIHSSISTGGVAISNIYKNEQFKRRFMFAKRLF